MANLKTKGEKMERTIKARFSNGVIKPLEKLDIEEGKEITITIERTSETTKTIESLRSSFGGWRNLIDTEELKRNIYKDRLITTRPAPKL
ncbi:antitoxin family protein [Candidatus Aerophobetes bacterium]|nr:antitoxin family protein [Candidatus Aerophobetes bacterium]